MRVPVYKYVVSIGSIPFSKAIKLLDTYHFVELRIDLVDWNQIEINQFVRAAKRIIVTYRPIVSDRQRMDVLQNLPLDAIDYLDIEIDGEEPYLNYACDLVEGTKTEIILSFHDYENFVLPDQILDRYAEIMKKQFIFKHACMVNDSKESASLLNAYHLFPRMILIGMGEAGRPTRLYGFDAGALFMYAYPGQFNSVAPGQVAFEDLELFDQERKSELFAVVGRPIIHSKSPQLFNTVFRSEMTKNYYTRIAVENLSELKSIGAYCHFNYFNVTAPFKYQCDSIHPAANLPSNTLVKKEGAWTSANTDAIALKNIIAESTQGLNNVLIIGAGGAAEAAILGLSDFDDMAIFLCARNIQATDALLVKYPMVKSLSWENLTENVLNHQGIVWTIPAKVASEKGVVFEEQQFIIDANYQQSLAAFSMITNPQNYRTGQDWLVAQAIPNISNLFPEIDLGSLGDLSRSLDENHLAKLTRICIIGLPASGKTSIGKQLAVRMNRKWIDMDAAIESEAGCTIAQLFENKGEGYFRLLESEKLAALSKEENIVVSSGGGVVMSAYNRHLLKNEFFNIWLIINPKRAASRIINSERPLLNNVDELEKMIQLQDQRVGCYADSSDLAIDVTERTIEETIERIYEEYCSVG